MPSQEGAPPPPLSVTAHDRRRRARACVRPACSPAIPNLASHQLAVPDHRDRSFRGIVIKDSGIVITGSGHRDR